MADRVTIPYKGFEISVLSAFEYGPPPPNPRFIYIGFICRSGNAESKDASAKAIFSQSLPTFASAAEALAAGQQKGRDIVDGKDPYISVDRM